MISHKHKFIFIHIPKAGGTSIENFLLSYHGIKLNWQDKYPLKKLSGKNRKQFVMGSGVQHKSISEFAEKFQKKYFCFTFVRNPWDWFVSEYQYSIKLGLESGSFNQFIEMPHVERFHLKPQYTFINENINFIGRFENLQEDFDIVCDKIGIPKQQLPHINKSEHKHYTEYYDDETRQIVAEKYAKDIEYFGYKFGE